MKSFGKLKPRVNLRIGQHVDLDGRLLRFRNRGRDKEHRLVFEGADGVPADMTDNELLAMQASGRLCFLTEAEVLEREAPPGRPRAILASSDAADGEEARRRLDYVRAWERTGRPSRTEAAIGPIVVNEFERRRESPRPGSQIMERQAPSPRHVLRWISEWLNSGGDIESLVPQNANRGNRTDKLHSTSRDIVERVIEKNYLNDTKPTAVSVHHAVQVAFQDYNAALPEAERIPTPSLTTTYRIIHSFDLYLLDFSREGPRTAEHRWRPVMGGIPTTRHNEVWEIDHTRVDLIVVDDVTGLPIGRPWVTVILDRHTRMVMGFYIGFDSPGTYPVMQCLHNAVLTKDSVLQKHPSITGSWPCFGVPEMLVPDQGREFKALSFTDACLSLGIDVQYTPVLKAWYKGKIERFFRTLTLDVFQRIPGTTFSNLFERNSEIAPDHVAVATLNELRHHTLRYLVEVYSKRRHRSLHGRSPLEMWEESVTMHGMRPMPDPKQITTALSYSTMRRPQRQGIEFEGLLYNNSRVAAFRIRATEEKEVRIAVDPNDMTKISFLDPADNRFYQVPIQPGMAHLVIGRTLEQHRLARAVQRSNPDKFAGSGGLSRAYTLIDRAMEQHVAAKGAKNRIEAARHWDALTRARPSEEPPAFDVKASADPLIDSVLEDVGGDESMDDTFPLEPVVDEHIPARPRAKRGRKPKAAEALVEAPLKKDDDDLAAFASRMGIHVNNEGK